MVRPHLEYGNVIWGHFYKEDHKSIERVQRRETTLVHNLRNLPDEERLRKLKIPSLEHRRRRGDMIIAYKLFTGNMNIDKCIFFQLSNLTSRGHKLKIFKQHAKKFTRVHTFSNRVVNDWNKLPPYIVEAKSLSIFKTELDKYWEDAMFMTPF